MAGVYPGVWRGVYGGHQRIYSPLAILLCGVGSGDSVLCRWLTPTNANNRVNQPAPFEVQPVPFEFLRP